MNTSPSQTRSLLIWVFKQASQFQMEWRQLAYKGLFTVDIFKKEKAHSLLYINKASLSKLRNPSHRKFTAAEIIQ